MSRAAVAGATYRTFNGIQQCVRGEFGGSLDSDVSSAASFRCAALTVCAHALQGAVACAVRRLQHDLDGLDVWLDGQAR